MFPRRRGGLRAGRHGDTMVPLVRYSSVAGIPLADLMDADTLQQIVTRTRGGGAEIVKVSQDRQRLLRAGRRPPRDVGWPYWDRKRVLPCCAYLEGEYGIHNLFVGVPVKLGAAWASRNFEARLTEEELAALPQECGRG